MSALLPPAFADLEDWMDWSLVTMAERSARRSSSSMQDIEAFYAAMLPRLEAVLGYLGDLPADDDAAENLRLLDLTKSLAEVAPAVELFFEPTISYGYDVSRFVADAE